MEQNNYQLQQDIGRQNIGFSRRSRPWQSKGVLEVVRRCQIFILRLDL